MSNRDVTETPARAVWWQLWETRHPHITAALPDIPNDKGNLAEVQAGKEGVQAQMGKAAG